MKKLLTVLTLGALVCGCHTEKNRGGTSSDESSAVQSNSRGSSEMQTNTQGSGAADLNNTNSATPPK